MSSFSVFYFIEKEGKLTKINEKDQKTKKVNLETKKLKNGKKST